MQAEADDINTLELYRGKSQPCFLFYAVSDSVEIINCICLMCNVLQTGGILVAVIRGANGPAIERTIKVQLEHEHKAINGDVERIAVR